VTGEVRDLVHDLRTPLAVVSGFAELLERDRGQITDEQRAEYVARIHAAARDMQAMLDAAGSPALDRP
jgi:signal transduction histidine kinase